MSSSSTLRDPKVNLAQIQVLVAVAEHGSVTGAAKTLNVTQPAVTKRIRELERALGVPLIERAGRGVVTTRFGEAFLRHGRAALAEIARASDAMSELRDAPEAVIHVGALPNAAYGLVPMAVAQMLEKSPHAVVSIVEGTLDPLISALRRGKLDIVVGALIDKDLGQDLAVETLFHDRLHVATRRGHPLADRVGLTLDDLRTVAWILPPRDVNAHRQWRNAFIFAGIEPPRYCVETASLAAVRALLLSSDGVALLAQHVVELEKRMGLLTVLPIELPSTTRAIGITTRARGALPETAGKLIASIRDVAMQYVAKSERQAARRQFVAPAKANRRRARK